MNKTLRELFKEHVAWTSPEPLALEAASASGVKIFTPDGRAIFDLVSGVSVSNVGHGHPKVVAAVQEQAARYMHLMVYGELVERPQVKYAERLCSLLPKKLQSVYFVNSGAEAIEGALKLAKRYTGRMEVLSFHNAYHGSTMGAMSILGGEEFKNSFRPLIPGCEQIPYGDFGALERIGKNTACVVAEVVQGEAGIRLAPEGFLKALRERCDRTGTLLVFDEIQTGMGRTGTMFGFEHYGVVPDILCLAKALGGGMPLGAFISSKGIMASLQTHPVLGHITTFGGHPVCCAAGLAALEVILDENLLPNADQRGQQFENVLKGHPAVVEIRRKGLLAAVELGSPERLFAVMKALMREGVMSDWFLFCDTAFRISPPLNITEAEVEECCAAIRRALDCERKEL